MVRGRVAKNRKIKLIEILISLLLRLDKKEERLFKGNKKKRKCNYQTRGNN